MLEYALLCYAMLEYTGIYWYMLCYVLAAMLRNGMI